MQPDRIVPGPRPSQCEVTRHRISGFLAASAIRALMGWDKTSSEEGKRRMAREQVAESRKLVSIR